MQASKRIMCPSWNESGFVKVYAEYMEAVFVKLIIFPLRYTVASSPKEGKTSIPPSTPPWPYYAFSPDAIYFSDCSVNSTLDAPLSPVKHNFSSPYWPWGYPVNKTCGWHITAPANRTVVLHLTHKLNRYSKKDTVEVYDADGSQLTLISLSGNSATVYSKYHGLYVLFKSDDTKNSAEQGFYASYTAITPGRAETAFFHNSFATFPLL